MVSFCLGKRNVKQCAMQSGLRGEQNYSFPWNTEIKYYVILLSRMLPSLDHSWFLNAMRKMLDALENSSRDTVPENMKSKLE